MLAGLHVAVSVQHGPNSPQISAEHQLCWRDHIAATPSGFPSFLITAGLQVKRIHRKHMLNLLCVLQCLHNTPSLAKSPWCGDSSRDVLRQQTQPQRAKSQCEACAAATYPIPQGLFSTRAGKCHGKPWGREHRLDQTSTHFSSSFHCFLAQIEPGPLGTALAQHRKATGILDAEKAPSPSQNVPASARCLRHAHQHRLQQKGRASSSSHPHLRTQIMVLSAAAAISQAQVAANNFQSKH